MSLNLSKQLISNLYNSIFLFYIQTLKIHMYTLHVLLKWFQIVPFFFVYLINKVQYIQSKMFANKLKYSDTCLNQTSLGPVFMFRIDRCSVYTVYSNKISYIRILFKAWFMQDYRLFRVCFRQVSLHVLILKYQSN